MRRLKDKLKDWYWEFAPNRSGKWSLSPNWLDEVMSICECEEHIQSFNSLPDNKKKATLAFWGPSQSGKSTFFSYYVDKEDPNNNFRVLPKESALTWDPEHSPVVFSGERKKYPDTTIFNPTNGGDDASGVVTRFYAPAEESEVDAQFPAEIILAPETLILQSLALGYSLLADNKLEISDITDKIASYTPSDTGTIDQKAFSLLRTLCNVCESTKTLFGRFDVFINDSEHKLRNQILKSTELNSSYENAKAFAAFLLWNENPDFTRVWKNIETFRNSLPLSENDSIFASMKVASCIENISGATDTPTGNILYRKEGSRLLLFDRSECTNIQGQMVDTLVPELANGFAYLQALVGEMRIPLKNNPSTPQSELLFQLLQKMDILDIPGTTNKSSHSLKADMENAQREDGRPIPKDLLLLTKVYKLGKTLAFIHGQSEKRTIDAFMIFIKFGQDGGLKLPDVLNGGIKAWLKAFGEPTDFNRRPNLKLYINLSCFSMAIENHRSSTGYSEWVNSLKGLCFSDKDYADYFFSSIKFFPFQGQWADSFAQSYITDESAFSKYCINDKSRESFDAMCQDGVGTDYIIQRLGREVNYTKRQEIYQRLHQTNREKLNRLILQALPADRGNETALRRSLLRDVSRQIDSLDRAKLMGQVKEVFNVSELILQPLPAISTQTPDGDLELYVNAQIADWINWQNERWEKNPGNRLIPSDNGNIRRFFEVISSIELGNLVELMRSYFSYLDSRPHARTPARHYFAMMLANMFLFGSIERPRPSEPYKSPAGMLTEPFKERIKYLIENTPGAGERPPFAGDDELQQIYKDLQNQEQR